MVQIHLNGCASQPKTVEFIPDWKKADTVGFAEALDSVDWASLLGDLNTEQSWCKFKETINELQLKFVPNRIRRSQNKPIWMTPNTLRIIRKKRRLWKAYTQTKEYSEYLAYKEIEKTTQKAIRKAKRKFEKNLAKEAKKKPKDFYRYLNSKTANRD